MTLVETSKIHAEVTDTYYSVENDQVTSAVLKDLKKKICVIFFFFFFF